MRGSVKRFAEGLLANLLPISLPRTRLRGRALVLALHNVVDDSGDAGADASLHLTLDSCRRLLDALTSSHQFTPLDDVLLGTVSDGARPCVAVTFDDAYRGALRNALPLMVERSIPATVFVIPGRLGRASMWWDRLKRESGTSLSTSEREMALTEGRGMEEEVDRLFGPPAWHPATLAADAGLATLEEIRQAARLPGVTIASHTWSHPNLTRLSDAELDGELRRSHAWLRSEAGPAYRPWLAYPYGRTDDRVASATAAAGYTAGFLVHGGWTRRPPVAPFAIPRVNIPAGLSADGLRLRGAGLLC